MFSIRHSNVIELLKIFSSHSDKINEISTSITATFSSVVPVTGGPPYSHTYV